MDRRKNIYSLTDAELADFIRAVNALKSDGGYDDFVRRHFNFAHGIHRGSAFLPWHRFFIREFELQLQRRVAGVALPYWNWTDDTADPRNAPLWNTDPAAGRVYIGGDGDPAQGDRVLTGPFSHWIALIASGGGLVPRPRAGLIRRLGRDSMGAGRPSFPTQAQVSNAVGRTPYDAAPWNATVAAGHRNRLEGWRFESGEMGSQLHNRVHLWVGGDMTPHTSPNDPVFFLHHANVDRLWAAWQERFPHLTYLPNGGGPAGHNLNDTMPGLSSADATPAQSLDYRVNFDYVYDSLAAP